MVGCSLTTDVEIVTSDALASGSNAEIVYSSGSGNAFYNENVSAAGFGDGGLFTTLTNAPTNLSTEHVPVVNA